MMVAVWADSATPVRLPVKAVIDRVPVLYMAPLLKRLTTIFPEGLEVGGAIIRIL